MGTDVILVIVVGTALAFDFTNGFHDTANAVATSISTRAMAPRVAVALAAGLNFVGAFLSREVAATLSETKAPTKLRTAALRTAARGERARVETLVAIEFAVSWKPFVKSKKSATATTATRVSSSTRR